MSAGESTTMGTFPGLQKRGRPRFQWVDNARDWVIQRGDGRQRAIVMDCVRETDDWLAWLAIAGVDRRNVGPTN